VKVVVPAGVQWKLALAVGRTREVDLAPLEGLAQSWGMEGLVGALDVAKLLQAEVAAVDVVCPVQE